MLEISLTSPANFSESLKLIRDKGIDCEIIFMQAEESHY